MWFVIFYLITAIVAQDKLSPSPQMFIIEQTRNSQPIEIIGTNSLIAQIPNGSNNINPPSPRLNVAPAVMVGLYQPCVNNFTCNVIPNTYCHAINKTCQCHNNFMEDPVFPGTCKLAPGYNEACSIGELECRHPFTCNSTSMCDCPSGYIQEYFQCIKDCLPGQLPIGEDCYPARNLNEKCDRNEQCVLTYSQCLRNKCQCIQGATNVNGTCSPVVQCPVGNVLKTKKGNNVVSCDSKDSSSNSTCPEDHYCMQAEFALKSGVCCPKLKMNCPIGQALDGRDCSNCPWETHHCFSYIIGGFTETMCCPNACPTSHPIQKENKCYARSAFGGHCEVDEQCYNVLGAMCRTTAESNDTICQCPKGNYRFYFGRCLKESVLGEKCAGNEECKLGTNTRCLNGVCSCYETFIPQPSKSGSTNTPTKCIAEPSCPTVNGLRPVREYTECTSDPDVCKNSQFCRQWWFDVNRTYALCCQRPTLDNYQNICKQFHLKLSTESNGKTVKRCDITNVLDSRQNDAINETESVKHCSAGASCLFDPFTTNKGICCEPAAVTAAPAVVDISAEHTESNTPVVTLSSSSVVTDLLVVTDLQPALVTEAPPSLVNKLVTEPQPPVVNRLVTEPQTPVVNRLVTEAQSQVITEAQPPMVTESRPHLFTDPQSQLVTESKEILFTETTRRKSRTTTMSPKELKRATSNIPVIRVRSKKTN